MRKTLAKKSVTLELPRDFFKGFFFNTFFAVVAVMYILEVFLVPGSAKFKNTFNKYLVTVVVSAQVLRCLSCLHLSTSDISELRQKKLQPS